MSTERPEPQPIFTIGHSTRPIDAFVALLRENGVSVVVDVRTVPKSRTNPQYNADALARSLAAHGIRYARIASLGGLRAKRRDVSPDVNGFWENQSFHNYADYAMSAPFRDGLAELRAIALDARCAIMCAEAVWWRCHRRIIADYLMRDGERVVHILGEGHADAATMTPAATPTADGVLAYPPPALPPSDGS
jgi:uncharacterized protein (DUF488 family)